MGALGGAVLLFAVGPRPRVRFDGEAPVVPQDLASVEGWLGEREKAVDGLRPDNEARIVWGGAPQQKTRYAFVALHGFSSSRGETAPLSENLARAYSANLFEARLTGHGGTGDALGRATAEDWVRDAREAIALGHLLGEHVIVVGVSTGATLAMLLAAEDRPKVAAYVLLSPNFGPRDAAAGLLLWPWAKHWIPLISGAERSWEPEVPGQAKYWTTRYPIDVLFSMMGLVERARTVDLSRVTEPVMILHSDEDPVVDPEAIEAAFIRLSKADPRRRKVVGGEGDHHVIAGDVMAPKRTESVGNDVKAFLRSAGIDTEPADS